MRCCRICEGPLEEVMSFGRMPMANGFLTPDRIATEYFFDLRIAFCPACTMVQLVEQPAPAMMFNENYAFYSSTSRMMVEHFRNFADEICSRYLDSPHPFIVEMGSNDGILLQHVKARGIRHLGIEPSANVAEVARGKGINTISKFFDERLASEIVSEYGQADAFLCANCMCHIPYIHSVFEGIRTLLGPRGVAAFEDPYIGDVIANTSYDQFYDEHVFIFSASAIRGLCARHAMELFHVEPQDTHGGSMRYYVCHRGAREVRASVRLQLERERARGLHDVAVYQRFKSNCERSKEQLMTLLERLRKEHRRTVGYAATSKSTTIINYCGITASHLEFISDTTPIKQGKLSPGAHIPIKPHAEFSRNYPDFALLFAYNHAKEIMAKETDFVARGGKWIMYVPTVQVLP